MLGYIPQGLLADLGETMGCSTNTVVIYSVTEQFSPLQPCLRHRQASEGIDCVAKFKDILKLLHWIKSYVNFAGLVDCAYWWSFTDGGSASNRATRLVLS